MRGAKDRQALPREWFFCKERFIQRAKDYQSRIGLQNKKAGIGEVESFWNWSMKGWQAWRWLCRPEQHLLGNLARPFPGTAVSSGLGTQPSCGWICSNFYPELDKYIRGWVRGADDFVWVYKTWSSESPQALGDTTINTGIAKHGMAHKEAFISK